MRPLVLLTRIGQTSQLRKLRLLGCLSVAIYGAVALLSASFQHDKDPAERPILAVLALFALASAVYLVSLVVVARGADGPKDLTASGSDTSRISFRGVLAFAILFRLVLLLSVPIQEIDFYRYLWDGRVLWEGHNPYRFAPAQIDAAGAHRSGELRQLAQIGRVSGPVETIFSRVHHRQVSTVYPPLAQVLFAACAAVTPAEAPVWIHVLVLKFFLILVDIAILFSMRGLLRRVGMSEAWCLAYGWCPLAVKEVANSAHVDALAVLFTLVALYLLVGAAKQSQPAGRFRPLGWVAGGGSLGLAILSKTYPVVLLLPVAAFAAAHLRTRAWVPVVFCLAVVMAGYLPFLDRPLRPGLARESFPPPDARFERQRPWNGLGVFLTEWQMNDLLFMVVHENLRQPSEPSNHWFVVTPSAARQALNRRVASSLAKIGLAPNVDPAFIATQVLMGTLLFGLVLWWSWQVFKKPQALTLLRSAFLVLAWAWLLSSAQNPWYVLWFLPLMPFARCRSWFLLPCLAFVYYLRFWLVYQGETIDPGGECPAFDYGWVWFEHGVVLAALAVEAWIRRRHGPDSLHSGVSGGLAPSGPAGSFSGTSDDRPAGSASPACDAS